MQSLPFLPATNSLPQETWAVIPVTQFHVCKEHSDRFMLKECISAQKKIATKVCVTQSYLVMNLISLLPLKLLYCFPVAQTFNSIPLAPIQPQFLC